MGNSNLDDDRKHYCFWLMKDYGRILDLFAHKYPEPGFKDKNGTVVVLGYKRRKQAAHYLNRIIRRHRGNYPRVKKARSFCVDANMYTVFEEEGAQYISVMGLEKGKRVIVPLLGTGTISGDLRIVLDCQKQRIEVHRAVDVKQRWLPADGVIEALDFGYTEAFTDHDGKPYGEGLGRLLSAFSDNLNRTGKARNKLHALEKEYRKSGKSHKANHIRKFNLGFKKKDRMRHRAQASVDNRINNGFNSMYAERHPSVVVTENLGHTFRFENHKGMNRKLSIWVRGTIQDRAEFKAMEGGSLHKQVNCAYGSQLCPSCGFLWSKNRSGDTFKCLFCGHEGHSDAVAATNYLHRVSDGEISLYTPYGMVKRILMERFLRRLERGGAIALPSGLKPETVAYVTREWESFVAASAKTALKPTVAGRTPDTGGPQDSETAADASRSVEGCSLSDKTTPVNRRANQPTQGQNVVL
jgi:transposase